MTRRRLPGIVPGAMPTRKRMVREPRREPADAVTDFTILVVGFDRKNFCAVIESIYVPEALDLTDAGWQAAEGYEAQTGIAVLPLYGAAGRINLEKLAADDVVI
jgi:hypothetical protein